MMNSPVASPTAFQAVHLLHQHVRSVLGEAGGVAPGVYEDLGPRDKRKCAEDLGFDLDGDIEILDIQ